MKVESGRWSDADFGSSTRNSKKESGIERNRGVKNDMRSVGEEEEEEEEEESIAFVALRDALNTLGAAACIPEILLVEEIEEMEEGVGEAGEAGEAGH